MRPPRFVAAVFCLAAIWGVAALSWVGATAPAGARGERPGVFDYWSLVLSWSPTYCAGANGRRDTRQCGSGRRYAFVVHGLWPQYHRGWPDYCSGRRQRVSDHTINAMLDIMPSKRLIIHEWVKHGRCSGLAPVAYFERVRELFARVQIPARYLKPSRSVATTPDQVRRDFLSTNRWLKASMISLHCGNRRDRARLQDVRLCFDRRFNPVACGVNEQRQCRANLLVLPPVRGDAGGRR